MSGDCQVGGVRLRAGDLEDLCGFAPASRRATRRCAVLLVALCLTAAACSSSPPVGQVGSTLSALGGTVTLDKVISPATLLKITRAVPAPGHKLVAVVLTVHSPTSAATDFAGIYDDSRLVDSDKEGHPGKKEGKFVVTPCVLYKAFATVPAGGTQTSCELFQLTVAAIPVELKILGKAPGDWTIAPTAIVAGAPGATVAAAPKPKLPVKASPKVRLGASPRTNAATTTTVAHRTTPTTTGTVAPRITTPVTPGHHSHHRVAGLKLPEILRINPRAGLAGTKVQIVGRRMSGVTTVEFDRVRAIITKRAPNKIVALVPYGAHTGPIVLVTAAGTVTTTRSFPVV